MTSPIAAPYTYDATAQGLMMWTFSELEHVGRIASIEESKIQYAYALSTVNGMAHLKDALYEYISKNPKSTMNHDLLVLHEKVVRVMRHLVATYKINIDTIKAFNTGGTLSPLNYLTKGRTDRRGAAAAFGQRSSLTRTRKSQRKKSRRN